MPSGPPELHRKWKSDSNAIRFLEARGWKLTRKWEWVAPLGRSPESEEYEAINYLILEWDFGGVCE